MGGHCQQCGNASRHGQKRRSASPDREAYNSLSSHREVCSGVSRHCEERSDAAIQLQCWF
jgi:hypothetical protein